MRHQVKGGERRNDTEDCLSCSSGIRRRCMRHEGVMRLIENATVFERVRWHDLRAGTDGDWFGTAAFS